MKFAAAATLAVALCCVSASSYELSSRGRAGALRYAVAASTFECVLAGKGSPSSQGEGEDPEDQASESRSPSADNIQSPSDDDTHSNDNGTPFVHANTTYSDNTSAPSPSDDDGAAPSDDNSAPSPSDDDGAAPSDGSSTPSLTDDDGAAPSVDNGPIIPGSDDWIEFCSLGCGNVGCVECSPDSCCCPTGMQSQAASPYCIRDSSNPSPSDDNGGHNLTPSPNPAPGTVSSTPCNLQVSIRGKFGTQDKEESSITDDDKEDDDLRKFNEGLNNVSKLVNSATESSLKEEYTVGISTSIFGAYFLQPHSTSDGAPVYTQDNGVAEDQPSYLYRISNASGQKFWLFTSIAVSAPHDISALVGPSGSEINTASSAATPELIPSTALWHATTYTSDATTFNIVCSTSTSTAPPTPPPPTPPVPLQALYTANWRALDDDTLGLPKQKLGAGNSNTWADLIKHGKYSTPEWCAYNNYTWFCQLAEGGNHVQSGCGCNPNTDDCMAPPGKNDWSLNASTEIHIAPGRHGDDDDDCFNPYGTEHDEETQIRSADTTDCSHSGSTYGRRSLSSTPKTCSKGLVEGGVAEGFMKPISPSFKMDYGIGIGLYGTQGGAMGDGVNAPWNW